MNVSRLVICGALLSLSLLLAGCGGEASAADKGPSAASAAPAVSGAPAADAAPVAQAAPVVVPPAADAAANTAAGGARPDLPHKAPVFHNAGAKRILPSRLVIPNIKVDTPVVELGWKTSKTASGSIFSEWDVADYAAGWHKNSSVPGEHGNVVMSGHNNILGSVFRELDQLKQGDKLEVFAGGTEYTYAVEEVLILPEKHASDQQRKANVKYIQETTDDRLTLVSCWPRDDNTHRIVVIARPTGETATATN
jgi:LPXTG-site transpeptidase (sortase) family protein